MAAAMCRRHNNQCFEEVPVCLWEADYSAVKAYLDGLRAAGFQDLGAYLADNPEAVARCSRLARILDLNRAALSLDRLSDKQSLLADSDYLWRTLPHDAFRQQLVSMADGQTRGEGAGRIQSPAGDERQALLRWAVLSGHEATWDRVLLSAVDITELKRAESVLLQRTLEMQERIEELDDFAHTVAHDLKNPLTSIVGYAEAVEEHYDLLPAEQVREFMRSIAWSGRKMTSIIQELLLLASVRMAEVQIMPLDMGRVVSQARQRLIYMIEQQHADIVEPDSWPLVQGYPPWIEEVWVNYLSNAIKYGGRPPRVELGATSQGTLVRFWVRDNGPGIMPEAQSGLFKPFSRMEHLRAEGHGLGLSIVKHIVEKLGGQVGMYSELGVGSTFYFTLPAVRLDQP